MKKMLLSIIILSVLLTSGCINYTQVGVVKYNNTTQEAFEECHAMCENFECIIKDNDGKCGMKIGMVKPRIYDCNNGECFCECG
jgi:hypothetical protein